MTTKRRAPSANVKIRPGGPLWSALVAHEGLPPSNTIPGARVLLRELTAAEVASLLHEQAMQGGWYGDLVHYRWTPPAA